MLNEDEVEELQRRFRGGPVSAGETTVLNVDDVKYVDTSVNPRDAQYLESRNATKEDILLALGTPESVLGNAANRTFANADTEREVFWTETMRPILAAWSRFWDALSLGADSDELFIVHDVSGVPELRRAAEQLETRHQLEVLRGTMSLNDYNRVLGRPEIDHPTARMHMMQRGVIIPGAPEDVEWLEENGYLSVGVGRVDPDLDAENEVPSNVTGAQIEAEVTASLPSDESKVVVECDLGGVDDLVAFWR
jgi:hypothetical protein